LACAFGAAQPARINGRFATTQCNQLRLCFSTLRPHRVGERFHHLLEHDVAGQTEDVVQAVGLAPRHHLMAAVMTIATDGDARVRPVAADTPHHAPQMAADLLAARRLARAQQNHYRTGVGGVIDVDGQKTALIVMSVKQRQLLIAVHNVAGIVDVEGDSGRRTI
jgi:hypothetical protein